MGSCERPRRTALTRGGDAPLPAHYHPLTPNLTSALVQLSPSAVIAIDGTGRITMLNRAAEDLLGVDAERARTAAYVDVLGPSLADRVVGVYLRTGGSAEPQTVEATLPSGRRVTLRATCGMLRDRDGKPEGFLFVAEDKSAEVEARAHAAREARVGDALRRYVGEAVADLVQDRPSFVGVRGVRQVVSVLHADVRGYTTLAESLEPERVMELLLRYHGAAVGALQAHGGLIDRFAGDAILALWNAPHAQPDHPRRALSAGLALQQASQAIGDELRYGVGVHSGEAIVGNLGSGAYVNYTAIGDSVNVAARLQSSARGGEVIASAAVLQIAGPGVQATPVGPLQLKGRREPVEAFRVEAIS